MKISSGLALLCVALSSVEAFAVPPQHLWARSLSRRAYRFHPIRRQIDIGGGQGQSEAQQQGQKPQRQGGGLTIGGLTLGGPNGGLTAGNLQLGGTGQRKGAGQQNRNATEAAGGKAPAAEAQKPAAEAQTPDTEPAANVKQPSAGTGIENQPGRAEGEAAKQEALKEAGQTEAAQEQKADGVKATQEAEQFSDNIGIVLNEAGNAQNIGGNLGITEGSDGSKSIGGENGINIAKNGQATVAGNDVSLYYATTGVEMSLRGGDTGAMRAHHRPGEESPALTDADTITDGYHTDRDANDDDNLKPEIQLSLAERRIDDLTARNEKLENGEDKNLKVRVVALKSDLFKQYQRASNAEKRAETAEHASDQVNLEEMQAMREEASMAAKEKDSAFRARDEAQKEAQQGTAEVQRLCAELKTVQVFNKKAVASLNEAREKGSGPEPSMFTQLHNTITARNNKIEQLVEKYDKLSAEHFETLKQVNKDGDATETLRVKLEGQETQMTDIRARLAAAETKRDWYKNEHAKLLAERNVRNATTFAANTTEVTNLSSENFDLKADIESLDEKIRLLKWDIACYVTDLDLSEAGYRVFTCRHVRLSDISDGQNSTREKTAGIVAAEFFDDYKYDDEFLQG
ncbi:hypothetical protein EK21DRAFT_99022 [Setomelanomma holmii]|uniref:Uncharacterized protein n=1 Tax=Setomelanomma holmii TaxID=210430 RepID=A0A9P4HCC2_9PLEO|nr:hypothetical protein EK21DRAFT_99022 [Setomelanomma holmii]